jgi:hypothetical protein
MRVLLAGGSGLIGSALRHSLERSRHDVRQLVRRDPRSPNERRWAPDRGELDLADLDGVDAVVCLSGVGIADHRWSDGYKRALRDSRLDSVGTIARAVAVTEPAPVLLSGSAVGYYGDTGDDVVDETAPSGAGFLAELCRDWEAASSPAQRAGGRVAQLRTGLVLAADGGLLKRLKPIVLAGAGGRIGDGRQYLPWISLADEVAAIEFLLQHEVHGAVNLTGPTPVRNAEFMSALGRVLRRPTVLPTPGFALRMVLGELAQDVLGGQRAVPAVLDAAGFRWQHPDLDSALRWALGR